MFSWNTCKCVTEIQHCFKPLLNELILTFSQAFVSNFQRAQDAIQNASKTAAQSASQSVSISYETGILENVES